jgi:hypothetical protein
MYILAASLLCTILPSQVTFASLTSAAGAFINGSYCMIALLRLFMTSGEFKWSKFKLGRFAKPFYVVAALFNAMAFAAEISPFFFPITAATFNFVSPSKHNRFLRDHAGLIDFSIFYSHDRLL